MLLFHVTRHNASIPIRLTHLLVLLSSVLSWLNAFPLLLYFFYFTHCSVNNTSDTPEELQKWHDLEI